MENAFEGIIEMFGLPTEEKTEEEKEIICMTNLAMREINKRIQKGMAKGLIAVDCPEMDNLRLVLPLKKRLKQNGYTVYKRYNNHYGIAW